MNLEKIPKNQILSKTGHENFFKYPFSPGYRRIKFHGKKIEKEQIYFTIKDLVNDGITSTSELSARLAKSTRQTRRYLKKMARLRMVKLDTQTGRLVKEGINYRSLSRDQFAKIPEISKWFDDCIARQVKPHTIRKYLQSVKYIFSTLETNPRNVISSKKSAVEHWTKFLVQYRKQSASLGTHNFRVGFRNFLASHDIIFPPRMGKTYGLSSAHDRCGSYAGVCFTADVTEEIGNMMLHDGDIELYTWWRVGLRTGARKGAITKMSWGRIYFDETNEGGSESFRLEQHETKDPRGQWFLGENGDWKTKYPPLDLKRLLLDWKARSGTSQFLWFEESDSDVINRKRAQRKAIVLTKRLKRYYEKISHRVDPRTREYMLKRPTHIMRHTVAQQMKDAGLTNEEIADSFGWRTPHIVGTWYTKISEKKRKELGARCSQVIF